MMPMMPVGAERQRVVPRRLDITSSNSEALHSERSTISVEFCSLMIYQALYAERIVFLICMG